jgi:hypothetical protein
MQFHESGLLNHKTVEDAFNYSFKNALSLKSEALKGFTDQMNMGYMQELDKLEKARQTGQISEADYNRHKQELDKQHGDHMKMGPRVVEQELQNMFQYGRLAPALEVQEYSDKPSPEVLAAVMLIGCVRSPVDYKNILDRFGNGVAGMIAEMSHIDAYPSERDDNLFKAGSDTKRVYLALLVTSLDATIQQVRQAAAQGQTLKVAFPPGQEESLFSDAKLLWNNDKKLSQRFLDVFNTMAGMAASPLKMEVSAAGDLQLVRGPSTPPDFSGPAAPPPPVIGGGGGPGIAGKDVW